MARRCRSNPNVVTTANGAVDAVVAGDGTLAYVAGGAVAQPTRTLVWVDRQGSETPIPAPPRAYVHPRLSPDGTRVAVFAADQELDLWIVGSGAARRSPASHPARALIPSRCGRPMANG